MSSQRPRQQRRSACNRCRMYKLRCERDVRRADGLCERCHKAGAVCAITVSVPSGRPPMGVTGNSTPSPSSHSTRSPGASSPRCKGQRRLSHIAPAPDQTIAGRAVQKIQEHGEAHRGRDEQGHRSPPAHIAALDGAALTPSEADTLLGSVDLHTATDDLDLSYFFPAETFQDPSQSPDGSLHQETHWRHCVEPLNGNLSDASHKSTNQVHSNLEKATHGAQQYLTPSSLIDASIGSSAGHADLLSPYAVSLANDDSNYTCRILQLSKVIAEDSRSMGSLEWLVHDAPNATKDAVQLALNRAAQFHELLTMMHTSDSSSTTPGSNGIGSVAPRACVVVTTSLITAYILLVRNWRCIFVYLHQILLSSPSPVNQLAERGFCIVPPVEAGGIPVRSSFTTQAAVLVDLSFNALGQIEELLGIGCWATGRNCQDRKVTRRQQLIDGPAAISVRDLLLTQEMARLDADPNKLYGKSLSDLSHDLVQGLREHGTN